MYFILLGSNDTEKTTKRGEKKVQQIHKENK